MSWGKRRKQSKQNEANRTSNNKKQKSSPAPPVIQDAQDRNTGEPEEQDKKNKLTNPQKQNTIVTPKKKEGIFSAQNIIGLLAVAISAVAVYVAVRANQQIAKQFEIENRPFIIMRGFDTDTLKPGKTSTIKFYFRNVGKTPALIPS